MNNSINGISASRGVPFSPRSYNLPHWVDFLIIRRVYILYFFDYTHIILDFLIIRNFGNVCDGVNLLSVSELQKYTLI